MTAAQKKWVVERGELIKKTRERLGMTIVYLAKEVGCTRQTISRIENGESSDIHGRVAMGLSRVLDISLAALVLGINDETVDLLKAVRVFEAVNDLEFTPEQRVMLAQKINALCELQDAEVTQEIVNRLLPILV